MRAHHICAHGTYVSFKGQGVLIEGEPNIGKSSLAISLTKRKFKIVADDCVILTKQTNSVYGFSPRKIRGFIMAPHLTDIAQTYGLESYERMAKLRLICHLFSPARPLQSNDKRPTIVYHHILGLSYPKVYVPVCSPHQAEQTIELMVRNLTTNQNGLLQAN